jgi:hypothetical protein
MKVINKSTGAIIEITAYGLKALGDNWEAYNEQLESSEQPFGAELLGIAIEDPTDDTTLELGRKIMPEPEPEVMLEPETDVRLEPEPEVRLEPETDVPEPEVKKTKKKK